MKKKPDSLKNRKGNENRFDTKMTNLKWLMTNDRPKRNRLKWNTSKNEKRLERK